MQEEEKKKLGLKKEKLRDLSLTQLARVAGGTDGGGDGGDGDGDDGGDDGDDDGGFGPVGFDDNSGLGFAQSNFSGGSSDTSMGATSNTTGKDLSISDRA